MLNDEISFKADFIAVCQNLNLDYNILAKRNYKGILIEYFRRFLNKNLTTAIEKRGTNNKFVSPGIATGYG